MLTNDGVIFISIDDNEAHNLKLLCDDVFGEQNFTGQIAVVNNLKGRNDRANIATTHEYLLMYVCDKFISGGIPLTGEQKAAYKYTDENGNQYDLRDLRKRGRPDRREDRPNMYFPIYYAPDTKQCSMTAKAGWVKITPLRGDGSDGRWRWGKEHVASSLSILHPEQNRNGKWGIKHRVYLNPALNPVIEDDEFDEFDEDDERTSKAKSFWQGGDLSNDVARRTLKKLMPDAEFDYPKSVDLIKRVLHMGTSSDCLVVDFFSGSATTMHASMELNAVGDGMRHCILIQLPENFDDKVTTATGESLTVLKKNIAFLDSVSRPHTLDQIGIERIIRAAKVIKESNPGTTADLGFKHFTLVEPSENTLDKL
ncbi:MAG: DNA methyltransferase, partial [bacterium]|nr:DNA methyltransferase [bacterium]